MRFSGSKLEGKIDQKSIKKLSPRWNASGHLFFYDFGGFRWPSWNAKSTQIGLTWRGEASRRGVARRGEAWRDVEGVKGVKGGSARAGPVGPNGLALLKGVDLPWTLDPWCRRGSGCHIATFCASWCPSFFYCFFDAVLDRSWLHFASQLGFQNPSKSKKNRCQEAFPS